MIIKRLLFLSVIFGALWGRGPLPAQTKPAAELTAIFRDAGITLLDRPVPIRDFSLPVLGGGTQKLSAYKGKVLFLNFWATWCGPCRTEMPSMSALYKRFNERGLEMFAVNLQETPEKVSGFMKENNLRFPVGLDRNGSAGSLYGVSAIPATYIIDKNSFIIGMVIGGKDWDSPRINAAFERLLE